VQEPEIPAAGASGEPEKKPRPKLRRKRKPGANRAVTGPSPRPSKWAAGKVAESLHHPKSARQRELEVKHSRRMTARQKKFAELYVEGTYSNTAAALAAGYARSSASVQACLLLQPAHNPHVCEYIVELQADRERKYGVTLAGQLKRLYDLSRGAEEVGQYSAAINAEKLRSVLGGLTVDRRETINSVDQLTREQILLRLDDLAKKYPQAFQRGDVLEGVYTLEGSAQVVDKSSRKE